MKRGVCLVVACLFSVVPEALQAQADISAWGKVTEGQSTVAPWVNYTKGKIMVDSRYNYDEPNTLAFFVGLPLTKGAVTITSSLGAMVGDYQAISPQIYITYNKGRAYVFTMNTYAVGRGYNFVYHWIDALLQIAPAVQVGLGEQIYRDTEGRYSFVDVGPTLRFTTGRYYIKLWQTWSTKGDPAKTYLILGTILP